MKFLTLLNDVINSAAIPQQNLFHPSVHYAYLFVEGHHSLHRANVMMSVSLNTEGMLLLGCPTAIVWHLTVK